MTIGPEGSVRGLRSALLKTAELANTSSAHGMGSNGRGLGAKTEAALPGWPPAFHPNNSPTQAFTGIFRASGW